MNNVALFSFSYELDENYAKKYIDGARCFETIVFTMVQYSSLK